MTKRHLLLISLLTFILAWRAEAQFTPQGFNYQCIVRDNTGASLNNQTVSLLFTVRSGAPNGPVAYSEMQTTSTNAFGLINLIVGQGTALQGAFNTINWGGSAKFLTVSVETSPNVFDELGTSQLMSVPYALYSQNAGNGADNWGTQTVQASPALSGNGTTTSPLTIAQQGAQNGQVLKWNGSTWLPQNDNTGQSGTVTEINTGAGLTGGPITASGTISLANTAVTPGVYGSGTEIPVITVDQQGRVTNVTMAPLPVNTFTGATGISVTQNGNDYTIANTGDTDASNDLTVTSQADGDISGPFSNLQIKNNAVGSAEVIDGSVSTVDLNDGAVTAAKLNNMGASTGHVLKWTGTTWAPSVDALGVVNLASGTGISVSGANPNFTITNTGDTDVSDDITTISVANGDITGPFSNLQIKPDVVSSTELTSNAVTTTKIASSAVTGEKIAQMSAANGQVLKWNGSSWAPANDNLGTVTITGGAGIDVIAAGNNYTIANSGDINPFDDITENSIANGDITGPFDNLQIKQSVVTNFELSNNAVSTAKLQDGAVNGVKISQMAALNGQVIKWNGTTWAPDTDNVGTGDNWGTQVVTSGATLSGNGSPVSPLIIAQQGATNAQVLKWNGASWAPANDSWGNQVAQVGPTLTGNGSPISSLDIAQQGATNDQVLKWNGASWVPKDDNDSGGDDWGAQTALTDATLVGDGAGTALGIAAQGANIGQVLKFDGTTWVPEDDNDSGPDNWGTQAVEVTSEFVGDGTNANPLELATQGANIGQVLKFNGASWIPEDDNNSGPDNWGTQTALTDATLAGDGAGTALGIAAQGANIGQVLKFDGTSWVPEDDNDSGPDNWGTQTALTDATLVGDGAGTALGIAAQGANIGQVLKFDGASWVPEDDNNSGPDNWGTQAVEVTSEFVGDGTNANPLELATQGANIGQVLKFNGASWIPEDDNNSGPDNWGTQTALTDATLAGDGAGTALGIAAQGATSGQVLKFNGTTWLPANDNTGTGPADNWGTQVIESSAELDGDGTAGNELKIAKQGATFGQALKWQGTFWGPADDEDNGDNWGVQTVESSSEFVGVGTNASPLTLSPQGAATGQVLKWTGTTWAPGNDLGPDTYSAGAGIDVTGASPNFTIVNTGDLSTTNELQTISLAGNNLSLSNGGGTVALPPSNSYAAGTGIDITGTAPNFTIINTGDSDSDPANELQNLSLNGKILKLSGTNSEVNLDTVITTAGIGLWTGAGVDIYNGNTGNVGIGTNSPVQKLHINGTGELLRLQGMGAGIGFANGASAGATLAQGNGAFVMNTADSSTIILSTVGGKTLTVHGITGNVGAGGVNTSNARFKVMHDNAVGGLMIENTAGAFWEFRVDAGTGGMALYNNTLGGLPAGFFAPNGVYTPSDRRLKKDIFGLSPVLKNIMQLEPVKYHYKQEASDSQHSIGFIAQDVEKYFPEMIGTTTAQDGTSYLGVNYAGLSVLAIKAIQEQQAQITALQQANNELLQRLGTLEARMQQVEQMRVSAEK